MKLPTLVQKKVSTTIQKLQLRRHFFDKKIDRELSNDVLQIYFELDGVSHHKLKLNHSYFEATFDILTQITRARKSIYKMILLNLDTYENSIKN